MDCVGDTFGPTAEGLRRGWGLWGSCCTSWKRAVPTPRQRRPVAADAVSAPRGIGGVHEALRGAVGRPPGPPLPAAAQLRGRHCARTEMGGRRRGDRVWGPPPGGGGAAEPRGGHSAADGGGKGAAAPHPGAVGFGAPPRPIDVG
eukprot:XP_025001845.1 translation initiation factor IF-2-like isoform X1 [Gallus gallus]